MGMPERIRNPFAAPEYTREFLSRFHLQQSQQAQLQHAIEEYVEENMQNIHTWAENHEVLPKILDDLVSAFQKGLIVEPNTTSQTRDSFSHKFQRMVQAKKGYGLAKLYDAQYSKEHPKRGGWGRWGNQTRAQIQPGVDRAAERLINRELDEAAEDDRKAGLDVHK